MNTHNHPNQVLFERFELLPDLFAKIREESATTEDPYRLLEHMSARWRSQQSSHKIGIPYRHRVRCSTGEHEFTEVQYNVFVFWDKRELMFTIRASEVHEVGAHGKTFTRAQADILQMIPESDLRPPL